ncbi:MAG: Hsp70 family protein, partial [Bacteroidales bacterium]
FHLVGLPPAPRGMPQIEVAFDIDANGIVNVSAKDQGTGKEQKITITASSGLNKDEVDRLVKEAESHSDEDKRRREVIDARNQADSLAYQVEKTLTENRDKLPGDDARKIEAAVTALREAAKGEDVNAIRKATDDLQTASHAMAEVLYRQSQGQPGQQPGGGAPNAGGQGAGRGVKEGEVVEGEYTETK